MDEPTRFVTAPELVPNALYDKYLFYRKLLELGIDGPFTEQVLGTLNDQFTLDELRQTISSALQQNRPRHREFEPVVQAMLTLAMANYEIRFAPDQNISERIIFPSSPTEANGIEDARFVRSTTTMARSATTPPTPPSTARSSCPRCSRPMISSASRSAL